MQTRLPLYTGFNTTLLGEVAPSQNRSGNPVKLLRTSMLGQAKTPRNNATGQQPSQNGNHTVRVQLRICSVAKANALSTGWAVKVALVVAKNPNLSDAHAGSSIDVDFNLPVPSAVKYCVLLLIARVTRMESRRKTAKAPAAAGATTPPATRAAGKRRRSSNQQEVFMSTIGSSRAAEDKEQGPAD
eukprot:750628-Pleurochrysis_carterae.AAC.1